MKKKFTKWGAIQENSLTKHKVKYESISKKKHGKDMLSVPDFHQSNEIFKVVSKRIWKEKVLKTLRIFSQFKKNNLEEMHLFRRQYVYMH